VARHLRKREPVETELGRFFVVKHAGHVGRNPATGKKITIAAAAQRYFVPSDALVDALGKEVAKSHRELARAGCDEGIYDRDAGEPVIDLGYGIKPKGRWKRVAADSILDEVVAQLKRGRAVILPRLGSLVVHRAGGELLTGRIVRCIFEPTSGT
jgi:nucleoid DNA-binding protein